MCDGDFVLVFDRLLDNEYVTKIYKCRPGRWKVGVDDWMIFWQGTSPDCLLYWRHRSKVYTKYFEVPINGQNIDTLLPSFIEAHILPRNEIYCRRHRCITM